MKIRLIEQMVRNQISVLQTPSPPLSKTVYSGNNLLYSSLGRQNNTYKAVFTVYSNLWLVEAMTKCWVVQQSVPSKHTLPSVQ